MTQPNRPVDPEQLEAQQVALEAQQWAALTSDRITLSARELDAVERLERAA
jgi:hypothetical protein